VREVLKQPPYEPLPVAHQIIVLLAVTQGLFDAVPLEKVAQAEAQVRRLAREELPQLCRRLETGEKLTDEDRGAILQKVAGVLTAFTAQDHGNH
jgi:F-type H+-transporting ATPase subunit alpha